MPTRELGGCRVSPNNPKHKEVKFCPKCREAEQRWNDLHAGEIAQGKLPHAASGAVISGEADAQVAARPGRIPR
jgi:hypothetical protein